MSNTIPGNVWIPQTGTTATWNPQYYPFIPWEYLEQLKKLISILEKIEAKL
jgi:hypothetical protein